MAMQLSPAYRLVELANGVYSVHSLSEAETFHPVIGPVAEAEALYVRQINLPDRLRAFNQSHRADDAEFVVWDVGLGAAANAVTVLRSAQPAGGRLRLLSFDRTTEPLLFALEHADALGYFRGFEETVRKVAREHQCAFTIGKLRVQWDLFAGDFPSFIQTQEARAIPKPHVILYDAYSPAKNPAMWTQPLFASVFRLLDPNRPCLMPTYSRSTMLRVSLLLAGFFVGSGHATGEKEETTIAANSIDLLDQPLGMQWLLRARNSKSAEPLWEPAYRQAPLSPQTWERLLHHPQFQTR